MATHTFQIVVTQSGAQAAAQAIGQVGAAAQKSASALAFFRQALVVASTVRAAAGFVDLIDAATRIDNRLRVATNSSQEFARAQQFVAQISRSTRTELESNAVTYGRLLKSTESLGLSSAYLEKVMTGLALSVKVGGATSQEARNAMIQFSQSLASGALRGDELRSVSEQLPALAMAIGREFGVSGGQLIAFAKANPGILETERVIKAVAAAVPELTEQAKKMTPTITEGFIAIHNAIVTMLGDLNRATGVFSAFSRGLVVMGDNLNIVLEIFAAFIAIRYAGTLAVWGGATAALGRDLVAMFQLMAQGNGVIASFNALLMVNPITLWIAAIAAAVVALTALYNYFPQVKSAVDGFFGSMAKIVEVLYQIVASIGQTLPSWVTMDGAMKVVANTVALLVTAFGNVITFALVPFVLAAEGVVRALNALGIASNESVAAVANARAELFSYAQSLLQGKQATVDAGQATEVLKQSTVGLLSPLLATTDAKKAAKIAARDLAEEIKKVDEGYRVFGERMTGSVAATQSSVDGFNNLARVTKDWEKYTTDAGTATESTTIAVTAAKAPTDSLASSMKGVNFQASGAARASQVMASSMVSSAESSTTAAKEVKVFSDLMAVLNPLMLAAKPAGEAAAAGFNAAGSSANDAAPGVRNLAAAYRELAAAQAAAGAGTNAGGTGATTPVSARAAGGPVLAGSTYLVGERGPELFTPNTTGNIIPNHALQSNGTSAANDNTTLIVKAINRMANAVVTSNKIAAASNETMVQEIAVQTENTSKALQRAAVPLDQSTSFKGTGYNGDNVSYTNDPRYNYRTYGSPRYGVNYFAGTDAFGNQNYTDPSTYASFIKDNKVLSGDAAYRENVTTVNDRGLNYFRQYAFDANQPYAEQIADASSKMEMLKAALERYGIDAFAYSNIDILGQIQAYQDLIDKYTEKSTNAIDALKKYRDAGENFKQFKEALPGLAAVASKVTDFQTLTPFQGGPVYGTSDPYGLASAPRPDPKAQESMSRSKEVGAQDNRVQVSMTVNTPNAETFRQNKAQIESQLASMVDRANRRAGRR